MITYKIKYDSTQNDEIKYFLEEGNKLFRCAFKLFQKNFNRSEVEKELKFYNFNHKLIDSSILRSICQDCDDFYKSYQTRNQKTLIFGGRANYKRYVNNLISKEEWNKFRNHKPISFLGAKNESLGNRKVKLNIEENEVSFKINRNTIFTCNLKNYNKRYNDLLRIQSLAEENKMPISYRLDLDYVYITFDESFLKKELYEFKEDRVAGIDLNPNYIAYVIRDKEEDIIYKEVFDLSDLNKTNSKNKKDFEVIQIAKKISKTLKHYKVELVGIEELNMKIKNHGKGKKYNKSVNNDWNRTIFSNNLKKRLNIIGIKPQNIVTRYSSTIGCLNYPDETDSIAAAIEICRRGYYFKKKYIDKEAGFLDSEVIYPKFDKEKIEERWNSILSEYKLNFPRKKLGYVNLHKYLSSKNKLNKLRFFFKDYNFSTWSFLRNASRKSYVYSYFSI